MTFHKLYHSSLISDFMEKQRKLTGSMNRRVNIEGDSTRTIKKNTFVFKLTITTVDGQTMVIS